MQTPCNISKMTRTQMTTTLVREITVDEGGNAILEWIRPAAAVARGREIVCGWDGTCRVQMNEKDDAWVTLGSVAGGATGVAPNTSYTSPTERPRGPSSRTTFIPRDDSTLVGHLYQKLIVRTYEGQDLTIGGRTAELYTIHIASAPT